MEKMKIKPIARHINIVVQELATETLVCDLATNRVFCLNQTAGEVWKLCDGKNDVSQIAELFSQKSHTKVSVEIVRLTLERLSKEKLLQNVTLIDPLFSNLSRREVLQRIGLASTMALPLITSIVMPTATHAQSQQLVGQGQFCVSTIGCTPGLICVDSLCCESACSGVCEKCNQAGRNGFCDAIPNGTDPDLECPSGPGLAGVCNGARACR